jgi:nucleoside-diphosphate-sugar epimerase
VPHGTLIDEEVRPAPANVYSRTKLAGSQAVLGSVAQGRVDGVVLRLANVCGPHPSPKSFPGKLLAMLRRAASEQQPLSVSIGAARLDYVDVRDVAEAVVRAGEVAAHRRLFNIGGGKAVTMRELVETSVVAAGFPVEMIRQTAGPPPASLGGDWTQVDIRMAAEQLGWVPRTPLAESLRAAWEEPD